MLAAANTKASAHLLIPFALLVLLLVQVAGSGLERHTRL
jgi:hypothetical protein